MTILKFSLVTPCQSYTSCTDQLKNVATSDRADLLCMSVMKIKKKIFLSKKQHVDFSENFVFLEWQSVQAM